VALQGQAETHQAQLRRAPWWVLLAGVGLMALVAGWLGARHTAPPSYDGPAWQTLQPVPSVPETVRPSDEPPARRPTRR
jgi:hypothetical protein